EQLVEDYLSTDPDRGLHRPMALLLTKADLLGPDLDDLDRLIADRFGMTRHAVQSHSPHNGLMAVSCLRRSEGSRQKAVSSQEGAKGSQEQGDPSPPPAPGSLPSAFCLLPTGLAEPLVWLAASLHAQDEARMERLWSLAGNHLGLLERCVACFARRYPDAPAAA